MMARLCLLTVFFGVLLLLGCKAAPSEKRDVHENGIYDMCDNSQPQVLDLSQFDQTSFYIRSPNYYNGNYPDNIECSYTLKTGNEGVSLWVTYEQFELEKVHNCRFDSLCVGGNLECADIEGGGDNYVVAPHSSFTFIFHSDSSVNFKGFKIRVDVHRYFSDFPDYVDLCKERSSNQYNTATPDYYGTTDDYLYGTTWDPYYYGTTWNPYYYGTTDDYRTTYPWWYQTTDDYGYYGTTRNPYFHGTTRNPYYYGTTRNPYYYGTTDDYRTTYPWWHHTTDDYGYYGTTRNPYYHGTTRNPYYYGTTRNPYYYGTTDDYRATYPWWYDTTQDYGYYGTTRNPYYFDTTDEYRSTYPWYYYASTDGYGTTGGINERILYMCDDGPSDSMEIGSNGPSSFILKSPNYGNGNYPDNMNCSLTLTTSYYGAQLKLHYMDFELEETRSCSYDSLCVAGNLECYFKKGSVETYGIPSYSTFTFVFSSDESVTRKGFQIDIEINEYPYAYEVGDYVDLCQPRDINPFETATPNYSGTTRDRYGTNSYNFGSTETYPWWLYPTRNNDYHTTNYPNYWDTTNDYDYYGTTRYPDYDTTNDYDYDTTNDYDYDGTTRYPDYDTTYDYDYYGTT